MTRLKALALGLGLCALPAASQAHHSFAMFDGAKTSTIVGTIKAFQWTNPHVFIQIVPNPGTVPGTTDDEAWSVELTSPGNLGRLGWTRTTLKPGDKVSIDLHPLRDGGHGGGFMAVTLPDGQVIKNGRSG